MPGGRPSKPLSLVTGHRTKAEIEQREAAESALMTGVDFKPWPAVRADKVALKEFNRLKKLFKAIDKNDGMFEGAVNRLCLLHSECEGLHAEIAELNRIRTELKQLQVSGQLPLMEYIDKDNAVFSKIAYLDKTRMAKRKAMLDIEKENLLTVQSALRSIPKKVEPSDQSPMAAFLKRKVGGNG